MKVYLLIETKFDCCPIRETIFVSENKKLLEEKVEKLNSSRTKSELGEYDVTYRVSDKPVRFL